MANQERRTDNGSPPAAYRVVGRLVDAKTRAPLRRFIVHAVARKGTAERIDLGYDVTNSQGLFSFVHTAPRTSGPEQTYDTSDGRRLDLRILDRRREEIHRTSIPARPGRGHVVEVPVPMPVAPKPRSPTLKKLVRKAKLSIPKGLHDELGRRGIRTLADVRRQGGFGHLEDLPVPADHPALRALEAHASLSAISQDLSLNATLIHTGFTSIGPVARASRADFIAAAPRRLGHFRAARMHVEAQTQTRFLSHVLMGLKADWANGFPVRIPGITNPHIPLWFRRTCRCEDCQAAVSPMAYLADLLDYAVHHLRNDGELIDVQFLADTFHQPFGDLPTTCDTLVQQVRQVRICIEVLREDRGRPLGERAQRDYCLAAYSDLLPRIGASFEELRRARTAAAEERQALAERLAIRL